MYFSLLEITIVLIIIFSAGVKFGEWFQREFATIPAILYRVGWVEMQRHIISTGKDATAAAERILNELCHPEGEQDSRKMAEDFVTLATFKHIMDRGYFTADYSRGYCNTYELTGPLRDAGLIADETHCRAGDIREKIRDAIQNKEQPAIPLRDLRVAARKEWLAINKPKMKYPTRRYDVYELE